MLFFIWRQTIDQNTKNQQESSAVETINNQANIQPTITDPYLKEAKDILNHFSAHTDQYGFYGLMQECQKNQNKYQCQVKTEKMFGVEEGEERAAWRDGLKVIWARFNYYQATNDSEELARLEQDIDNLITKVVDNPSTILQSGDFTCLYLAPIIESSDVSQKTRDQAKRLCLESTIEYAPTSNLAFSQYQRPIVVVTGYSGDDENLPIVGTMFDKYPVEMVRVYTKDEVIEQINRNLNQISQNRDYKAFSYRTPITDQPKFFHREVAAAIDLIFKMNLALKENKIDAYNLAEIEYLLLIEELFSWYMANMLELDDDNICLFSQAINHYFSNYNQPLDMMRILQYNDFYWQSDSPDLICHVARISLNPDYVIDKSVLQNHVKINGVSDWQKGLMYKNKTIENSYYYLTGYNSLLAGLYTFNSK